MYEGWAEWRVGLGPGAVDIRKVTDVTTTTCGDDIAPNFFASITRLTFRTADGTEIELRDAVKNGEISTMIAACGQPQPAAFNRGAVFRSTDGSALTLVASQDIHDFMPGGITEDFTFSSQGFVSAGVLYFPNGTRYEISGGNITKIIDSNGNYITIAYDGMSRVDTITDSKGRSIDFIHDSGEAVYTTEIQFPGTGGLMRFIYIRRARLEDVLLSGTVSTIASLFGATTMMGTFNPVVTSEVELPNGKKYEFKYNEYGDLAQVVLPTGGKIEYDWAAFPGQGTGGFAGVTSNTGAQVIRGVIERRTYSDATTLVGKQVMSYSFLAAGSCTVGGSSNIEATSAEVAYQDGSGNPLSKETHYYCDKPGNESPGPTVTSLKWSAWKAGKEYKTEYFDTDGSLSTIRRCRPRPSSAA
jgi:hypothetical protein